jgi:glycosyltransferase 2 family protein
MNGAREATAEQPRTAGDELIPELAPETGRGGTHLRGAIGLLISVLSLAAVVWWALRQPTPSFPSSPGRIALIVVAVGAYGVATVVRGWRWHSIMRHGHVEHDPVDAYALVPVGYMGNTVLPARGGEVLRILLLSRRSSAKRREILGTIISERLLDAFSLALLFVALTWIDVADSPVGQRPALIALLTLGALGVALQGYLMLRRRGHLERFATAVRPVARASRPLLGRWGAALCGVSLGVWCIEGLIFWLVAQSLELDVTIPEGLFLLVLTAFFSLIPAAPGYVGTFDAAVVFGLKAVGVVGGQAVAFALLVRFVLFVPITVAGLALLVTRYGGLRQLRRE